MGHFSAPVNSSIGWGDGGPYYTIACGGSVGGGEIAVSGNAGVGTNCTGGGSGRSTDMMMQNGDPNGNCRGGGDGSGDHWQVTPCVKGGAGLLKCGGKLIDVMNGPHPECFAPAFEDGLKPVTYVAAGVGGGFAGGVGAIATGGSVAAGIGLGVVTTMAPPLYLFGVDTVAEFKTFTGC